MHCDGHHQANRFANIPKEKFEKLTTTDVKEKVLRWVLKNSLKIGEFKTLLAYARLTSRARCARSRNFFCARLRSGFFCQIHDFLLWDTLHFLGTMKYSVSNGFRVRVQNPNPIYATRTRTRTRLENFLNPNPKPEPENWTRVLNPNPVGKIFEPEPGTRTRKLNPGFKPEPGLETFLNPNPKPEPESGPLGSNSIS